MNRRHFLASTAAAAVAASLRGADTKRAPRILLRSSWQSVNIGDIGHTPGALSLLWNYFPECEITLWPGELGHGSRDLLTKGYPRLKKPLPDPITLKIQSPISKEHHTSPRGVYQKHLSELQALMRRGVGPQIFPR